MNKKIAIPKEFKNARNVASSYQCLDAGESVTIEVEGGFVSKTLPASAVIYRDANGREMIVFDDDEEES